MKKLLAAGILASLLTLNLLSEGPGEPERLYANIIFTVFRFDHWPQNVERSLNLPIPQVYEESWIHVYLSLDITDGRRQAKAIDKEEFRFELAAESLYNLSLRVIENGCSRFYFEHHRPSTACYLFYGMDSRIYLLKVLFSTGEQPVGPLSPGIRR